MCACPSQKRPRVPLYYAVFKPLWLFTSAWTVPSYFWSCPYWLLDPDFEPTIELAEHVVHMKLGRLKCDILEESLGLARISECLQQMVLDVNLCASFTEPPLAKTHFLFASPYPSTTLVQAFAHMVHKYSYLQPLWTRFCETRNIVTWTHVQPSTVRCFLPWLLQVVNHTWNLLHTVHHNPLVLQIFRHCMSNLRRHHVTQGFHLTPGTDLCLNAPLLHSQPLPFTHMPLMHSDSRDLFTSPWSFLQSKGYLDCLAYRPYLGENA